MKKKKIEHEMRIKFLLNDSFIIPLPDMTTKVAAREEIVKAHLQIYLFNVMPKLYDDVVEKKMLLCKYEEMKKI